MTDKEKAIVMAHTGICMLTGDKFQIFHKYVEDIMGRPIMTHELGWLADTIKEKSKDDFLVLCAEQELILDKIREEIEQAYCKAENDYDKERNYGLYIAEQIIDDYKLESEG